MNAYHIMVLDNDESVATLLKTNLQSVSFNCIDCFTDPVKAIETFRNKKYHILLTDMDIPEMDGIEILTLVRKLDPMTQVIMMTAKSTMDRALNCLELGASDYILRPFKNDDCMIAALEDAVKKLERWKEAIKGTILKHSELSQPSHTDAENR